MRLSAILSTGLLLAASCARGADNGAAAAILQEKCLTCHGETTATSGSRLTSRENLLKGGSRGPAIVPGKSTESLLYKAVSGSGEVLRMPPVGGGLPAAEIAVIKEWLDAGALWPNITPVNYQPVVGVQEARAPGGSARLTNPIDAFIDRKLKTAGILPPPKRIV